VPDLEKATRTQLANIEKRTGKSIDELARIIQSSGASKHGQLVAMLKSTLGMGHGDANQGISHLTAEPAGSGLVARVNVHNTGGEDATRLIRLTVDGQPAGERWIDIPAREHADETFELP
jgi:hypothetical protein